MGFCTRIKISASFFNWGRASFLFLLLLTGITFAEKREKPYTRAELFALFDRPDSISIIATFSELSPAAFWNTTRPLELSDFSRLRDKNPVAYEEFRLQLSEHLAKLPASLPVRPAEGDPDTVSAKVVKTWDTYLIRESINSTLQTNVQHFLEQLKVTPDFLLPTAPIPELENSEKELMSLNWVAPDRLKIMWSPVFYHVQWLRQNECKKVFESSDWEKIDKCLGAVYALYGALTEAWLVPHQENYIPGPAIRVGGVAHADGWHVSLSEDGFLNIEDLVEIKPSITQFAHRGMFQIFGFLQRLANEKSNIIIYDHPVSREKIRVRIKDQNGEKRYLPIDELKTLLPLLEQVRPEPTDSKYTAVKREPMIATSGKWKTFHQEFEKLFNAEFYNVVMPHDEVKFVASHLSDLHDKPVGMQSRGPLSLSQNRDYFILFLEALFRSDALGHGEIRDLVFRGETKDRTLYLRSHLPRATEEESNVIEPNILEKKYGVVLGEAVEKDETYQELSRPNHDVQMKFFRNVFLPYTGWSGMFGTAGRYRPITVGENYLKINAMDNCLPVIFLWEDAPGFTKPIWLETEGTFTLKMPSKYIWEGNADVKSFFDLGLNGSCFQRFNELPRVMELRKSFGEPQKNLDSGQQEIVDELAQDLNERFTTRTSVRRAVLGPYTHARTLMLFEMLKAQLASDANVAIPRVYLVVAQLKSDLEQFSEEARFNRAQGATDKLASKIEFAQIRLEDDSVRNRYKKLRDLLAEIRRPGQKANVVITINWDFLSELRDGKKGEGIEELKGLVRGFYVHESDQMGRINIEKTADFFLNDNPELVVIGREDVALNKKVIGKYFFNQVRSSIPGIDLNDLLVQDATNVTDPELSDRFFELAIDQMALATELGISRPILSDVAEGNTTPEALFKKCIESGVMKPAEAYAIYSKIYDVKQREVIYECFFQESKYFLLENSGVVRMADTEAAYDLSDFLDHRFKTWHLQDSSIPRRRLKPFFQNSDPEIWRNFSSTKENERIHWLFTRQILDNTPLPPQINAIIFLTDTVDSRPYLQLTASAAQISDQRVTKVRQISSKPSLPAEFRNKLRRRGLELATKGDRPLREGKGQGGGTKRNAREEEKKDEPIEVPPLAPDEEEHARAKQVEKQTYAPFFTDANLRELQGDERRQAAVFIFGRLLSETHPVRMRQIIDRCESLHEEKNKNLCYGYWSLIQQFRFRDLETRLVRLLGENHLLAEVIHDYVESLDDLVNDQKSTLFLRRALTLRSKIFSRLPVLATYELQAEPYARLPIVIGTEENLANEIIGFNQENAADRLKIAFSTNELLQIEGVSTIDVAFIQNFLGESFVRPHEDQWIRHVPENFIGHLHSIQSTHRSEVSARWPIAAEAAAENLKSFLRVFETKGIVYPKTYPAALAQMGVLIAGSDFESTRVVRRVIQNQGWDDKTRQLFETTKQEVISLAKALSVLIPDELYFKDFSQYLADHYSAAYQNEASPRGEASVLRDAVIGLRNFIKQSYPHLPLTADTIKNQGGLVVGGSSLDFTARALEIDRARDLVENRWRVFRKSRDKETAELDALEFSEIELLKLFPLARSLAPNEPPYDAYAAHFNEVRRSFGTYRYSPAGMPTFEYFKTAPSDATAIMLPPHIDRNPPRPLTREASLGKLLDEIIDEFAGKTEQISDKWKSKAKEEWKLEFLRTTHAISRARVLDLIIQTDIFLGANNRLSILMQQFVDFPLLTTLPAPADKVMWEILQFRSRIASKILASSRTLLEVVEGWTENYPTTHGPSLEAFVQFTLGHFPRQSPLAVTDFPETVEAFKAAESILGSPLLMAHTNLIRNEFPANIEEGLRTVTADYRRQIRTQFPGNETSTEIALAELSKIISIPGMAEQANADLRVRLTLALTEIARRLVVLDLEIVRYHGVWTSETTKPVQSPRAELLREVIVKQIRTTVEALTALFPRDRYFKDVNDAIKKDEPTKKFSQSLLAGLVGELSDYLSSEYQLKGESEIKEGIFKIIYNVGSESEIELYRAYLKTGLTSLRAGKNFLTTSRWIQNNSTLTRPEEIAKRAAQFEQYLIYADDFINGTGLLKEGETFKSKPVTAAVNFLIGPPDPTVSKTEEEKDAEKFVHYVADLHNQLFQERFDLAQARFESIADVTAREKFWKSFVDFNVARIQAVITNFDSLLGPGNTLSHQLTQYIEFIVNLKPEIASFDPWRKLNHQMLDELTMLAPVLNSLRPQKLPSIFFDEHSPVLSVPPKLLSESQLTQEEWQILLGRGPLGNFSKSLAPLTPPANLLESLKVTRRDYLDRLAQTVLSTQVVTDRINSRAQLFRNLGAANLADNLPRVGIYRTTEDILELGHQSLIDPLLILSSSDRLNFLEKARQQANLAVEYFALLNDDDNYYDQLRALISSISLPEQAVLLQLLPNFIKERIAYTRPVQKLQSFIQPFLRSFLPLSADQRKAVREIHETLINRLAEYTSSLVPHPVTVDQIIADLSSPETASLLRAEDGETDTTAYLRRVTAKLNLNLRLMERAESHTYSDWAVILPDVVERMLVYSDHPIASASELKPSSTADTHLWRLLYQLRFISDPQRLEKLHVRYQEISNAKDKQNLLEVFELTQIRFLENAWAELIQDRTIRTGPIGKIAADFTVDRPPVTLASVDERFKKLNRSIRISVPYVETLDFSRNLRDGRTTSPLPFRTLLWHQIAALGMTDSMGALLDEVTLANPYDPLTKRVDIALREKFYPLLGSELGQWSDLNPEADELPENFAYHANQQLEDRPVFPYYFPLSPPRLEEINIRSLTDAVDPGLSQQATYLCFLKLMHQSFLLAKAEYRRYELLKSEEVYKKAKRRAGMAFKSAHELLPFDSYFGDAFVLLEKELVLEAPGERVEKIAFVRELIDAAQNRIATLHPLVGIRYDFIHGTNEATVEEIQKSRALVERAINTVAGYETQTDNRARKGRPLELQLNSAGVFKSIDKTNLPSSEDRPAYLAEVKRRLQMVFNSSGNYLNPAHSLVVSDVLIKTSADPKESVLFAADEAAVTATASAAPTTLIIKQPLDPLYLEQLGVETSLAWLETVEQQCHSFVDSEYQDDCFLLWHHLHHFKLAELDGVISRALGEGNLLSSAIKDYLTATKNFSMPAYRKAGGLFLVRYMMLVEGIRDFQPTTANVPRNRENLADLYLGFRSEGGQAKLNARLEAAGLLKKWSIDEITTALADDLLGPTLVNNALNADPVHLPNFSQNQIATLTSEYRDFIKQNWKVSLAEATHRIAGPNFTSNGNGADQEFVLNSLGTMSFHLARIQAQFDRIRLRSARADADPLEIDTLTKKLEDQLVSIIQAYSSLIQNDRYLPGLDVIAVGLRAQSAPNRPPRVAEEALYLTLKDYLNRNYPFLMVPIRADVVETAMRIDDKIEKAEIWKPRLEAAKEVIHRFSDDYSAADPDLRTSLLEQHFTAIQKLDGLKAFPMPERLSPRFEMYDHYVQYLNHVIRVYDVYWNTSDDLPTILSDPDTFLFPLNLAFTDAAPPPENLLERADLSRLTFDEREPALRQLILMLYSEISDENLALLEDLLAKETNRQKKADIINAYTLLFSGRLKAFSNKFFHFFGPRNLLGITLDGIADSYDTQSGRWQDELSKHKRNLIFLRYRLCVDAKVLGEVRVVPVTDAPKAILQPPATSVENLLNRLHGFAPNLIAQNDPLLLAATTPSNDGVPFASSAQGRILRTYYEQNLKAELAYPSYPRFRLEAPANLNASLDALDVRHRAQSEARLPLSAVEVERGLRSYQQIFGGPAVDINTALIELARTRYQLQIEIIRVVKRAQNGNDREKQFTGELLDQIFKTLRKNIKGYQAFYPQDGHFADLLTTLEDSQGTDPLVFINAFFSTSAIFLQLDYPWLIANTSMNVVVAGAVTLPMAELDSLEHDLENLTHRLGQMNSASVSEVAGALETISYLKGKKEALARALLADNPAAHALEWIEQAKLFLQEYRYSAHLLSKDFTVGGSTGPDLVRLLGYAEALPPAAEVAASVPARIESLNLGTDRLLEAPQKTAPDPLQKLWHRLMGEFNATRMAMFVTALTDNVKNPEFYLFFHWHIFESQKISAEFVKNYGENNPISRIIKIYLSHVEQDLAVNKPNRIVSAYSLLLVRLLAECPAYAFGLPNLIPVPSEAEAAGVPPRPIDALFLNSDVVPENLRQKPLRSRAEYLRTLFGYELMAPLEHWIQPVNLPPNFLEHARWEIQREYRRWVLKPDQINKLVQALYRNTPLAPAGLTDTQKIVFAINEQGQHLLEFELEMARTLSEWQTNPDVSKLPKAPRELAIFKAAYLNSVKMFRQLAPDDIFFNDASQLTTSTSNIVTDLFTLVEFQGGLRRYVQETYFKTLIPEFNFKNTPAGDLARQVLGSGTEGFLLAPPFEYAEELERVQSLKIHQGDKQRYLAELRKNPLVGILEADQPFPAESTEAFETEYLARLQRQLQFIDQLTRSDQPQVFENYFVLKSKVTEADILPVPPLVNEIHNEHIPTAPPAPMSPSKKTAPASTQLSFRLKFFDWFHGNLRIEDEELLRLYSALPPEQRFMPLEFFRDVTKQAPDADLRTAFGRYLTDLNHQRNFPEGFDRTYINALLTGCQGRLLIK